MLDQLRVALKRIDDLQRLVPSLLDRIGNTLGHAVRRDQPIATAGLPDSVQAPVLGFQDQQAAARVQHDEVGMALLGPDGHVEPQQVVVVELLLQALCQSALAGRHAGDAGAQRGNQDSHEDRSPGSRRRQKGSCNLPKHIDTVNICD
ncbi:hypothetical protein D9M72_475550 [compost metagenome]